jgi:SecD/SecF fusion protein
MSRGLQIRLALLLALIGWAVYQLLPTFQFWPLTVQERQMMQLTDKAKFDELQTRSIKRGLDLQGGVFLVLEVDPARSMTGSVLADAVEGARRVIEQRVNQYGVSEANVQKIGERRIIIELPGLDNIEAAMRLVGRTALLSFNLLRPVSERDEVVRRIDAALPRLLSGVAIDTAAAAAGDTVKDSGVASVADSAAKQAPKADLFGGAQPQQVVAQAKPATTDSTEENPLKGLTSFSTMLEMGPGNDFYVSTVNKPKVDAVLNLIRTKSPELVPSAGEFLFGKEEIVNGKYLTPFFYVSSRADMTGASVKDAQVSQGSNLDMEQAGRPVINFEVKGDSVRLFSAITRRNRGERMAIILDKVVYSAPTIQAHINDGRSIITGMADKEEARSLAIAIRSGALPAEVQVQEQRYVGPSLGTDSIESSLQASWIGGLAVVLFMIAYYRIGGMIAVVSQMFNIVLVMASLAALHGTLTLPGVAGLILTLGMAVDSNVLIFERMREERASGKSARATIESGFGNAASAIWDSNITTLISAVALYQFGTGPIRGFALVLMIGIAGTVFSALFTTRFMYDLWASVGHLARVSLGKPFLKNPKFQFLKWRNPWFIGSGAILTVAIVAMVTLGFNWGVDFTGGTRLAVRFVPAVKTNDVRNALKRVPIRSTVLNLSQSEIKTVDQDSDLLITVKQYRNFDAAAVDSAIRLRLREVFPANTNGDWVLNAESVGPKIGSELKYGAIYAVGLALLGILIYLAIRFELIYALATTASLFHDVLLTLGVFAIVRHEVTLSVVAAVLTMVGYSLNDTIVVFDRIREGLRVYAKRLSFGEILDKCINETLTRTIITSGTTLMAVVALLVFGGETLKDFAFVLFIGILTGTYSSIYVAAALVYVWQTRQQKNAAETALRAVAAGKTARTKPAK